MGDDMLFNIGDIVTRTSHGHDVFFRIMDIVGEEAYLKGINMRLYADSYLTDLKKVENKKVEDDEKVYARVSEHLSLDRSEFFYLPGKVLHVDGDENFLNRCLSLYKKLNIMCYGLCLPEADIASEIEEYLNKLNPDILVITGHDAYYKKRGSTSDIDSYKNSRNFIEAVKSARRYEKDQDKLIIVAGACQSNYEELIKSGATFASSPKRINIHALDPAIIASELALADRNKTVDLVSLLEKTKYFSEGIGGVITKGSMFVGYPR